MPTVPRLTEQQVSPGGPATPFRDPGSVPSGAFASPISGEGVADLSDQLREAVDTIQRRTDATARVRAQGQAQRQLRELYVAEREAGEDFADPARLDIFSTAAREIVNTTIEQHGGSAESQARLSQSLHKDLNRYLDAAAMQSVEANRAILEREVDGFINQQAIAAFENPSSLPERFAEIDETLEVQFGDAMTPQQLEAKRAAGYSMVTEGAMDYFIKSGQIDEAENMLSDPIVRDTLGAQNMRKIQQRITEVRSVQNEASREGRAVRLTVAAALGINPEDVPQYMITDMLGISKRTQKSPTKTDLAFAAADGDERAAEALRLLNEDNDNDRESFNSNDIAVRAAGQMTGDPRLDAMSPDEAEQVLETRQKYFSGGSDPFLQMLAGAGLDIQNNAGNLSDESVSQTPEQPQGQGGGMSVPVDPAGQDQNQSQGPSDDRLSNVQNLSDEELRGLAEDVNNGNVEVTADEANVIAEELRRRAEQDG